MERDEVWRARIRSALRHPEPRGGGAVADASFAIEQGTRRLAASAGTRAAVLALALTLALALVAWGWAQAESARTAEAILRGGAPWTP